jgi:hypothetical protein
MESVTSGGAKSKTRGVIEGAEEARLAATGRRSGRAARVDGARGPDVTCHRSACREIAARSPGCRLRRVALVPRR